MPLTLSTARVKEKLGISHTDYDAAITTMIADWLSVLNYAIDAEFLDDMSNAGLQATLFLGALEVVAGEVAAYIARLPGMSEAIEVEGLTLTPIGVTRAQWLDLRVTGWAKLQPFLKKELAGWPPEVAGSGNSKWEMEP
jgi:hypothetical protein